MRIIAGSLGGRVFDSPSGNRSHPMSERVRGGLFNALGDIVDLTVLDTFAGSGALGFEAISRGASSALAIEVEKAAHKTIKENIGKLGLEHSAKAIRANVSAWSDNNQNAQFDLVLCDPPYNKLQVTLLQKLTKHLKKSGLLVISWPGKLKIPEFTGLDKLKELNYGDAQLVFYRKTG